MNKKLAIFLVIVLLIVIFLPQIFHSFGRYPEYTGNTNFNLQGRNILMVASNHANEGDIPTGVVFSMISIPYGIFTAAGINVDFASPEGGQIPINRRSLNYFYRAPEDKLALLDTGLMDKLANSAVADKVNFLKYDAIYILGGPGGSYDLPGHPKLVRGLSRANRAGIYIAGVDSAPSAFVGIVDEGGNRIITRRNATGITDAQKNEMFIYKYRITAEDAIKKYGGFFQRKDGLLDSLVSLTVVDGNLISGQNQNSSKEVAYTLLELLTKNPRRRY